MKKLIATVAVTVGLTGCTAYVDPGIVIEPSIRVGPVYERTYYPPMYRYPRVVIHEKHRYKTRVERKRIDRRKYHRRDRDVNITEGIGEDNEKGRGLSYTVKLRNF